MPEDQYVSGEEYQAMRRARPNKPGTKVNVSSRTLAWIAAVVILCVISFGAGIAYQRQSAKTTAAALGSPNTGVPGGAVNRRARGRLGQVTAISSSSITISNQRTGATTTYAINGSTTITDTGQTVSYSTVQVGDTVAVTTSSSDASVATTIVLNPRFGGGAAGGATPTPSIPNSTQTN